MQMLNISYGNCLLHLKGKTRSQKREKHKFYYILDDFSNTCLGYSLDMDSGGSKVSFRSVLFVNNYHGVCLFMFQNLTCGILLSHFAQGYCTVNIKRAIC